MSEVKGKLTHGLKIGEDVHTDFVLREATAGDIIDSTVEAERLMETARGHVLVASPGLAGPHVLRRQIARIGGYDGVVTLKMLKSLSQEDLGILQDHADKLEVATSKAASERGRDDPPSGNG